MSVQATRPPLPDAIAGPGVIAIARRVSASRLIPIARALARAGVGAVEVTLDGDEAIERLATVSAEAARLDRILVGAGTVLDVASAEQAVAAGARFLVMPHTEETLIRWAVERDVPVIPGAFTPSEILAAWRAGATAVKLFPASVAGPAFVRELRGPLPGIPLVATGGVTLESTAGFIEAGAAAVGVGGWLIGDGEPEAIEQRGRDVLAAIRRARGPAWRG